MAIPDNIRLDRTCNACPEQYDVYLNGVYFGYLRLRHGYFRAENVNHDVVYSAHPRGDGIFEPDERDQYLEEAVNALLMNDAKRRVQQMEQDHA